MTRKPFYQQENDKTNLARLETLQASLDTREKEISTAKTNVNRYETELAQMTETHKKALAERNRLRDEVEKMKAHRDPNSLSLSDVMKKLEVEDPSRFRSVMNDLEYQGKDPAWFQNAFAEQLG